MGCVREKWVGTQQVHIFRGYSGSGESLKVRNSCARGRAPAVGTQWMLVGDWLSPQGGTQHGLLEWVETGGRGRVTGGCAVFAYEQEAPKWGRCIGKGERVGGRRNNTVPYGWLLVGTESRSLHGIVVSALSPCSRAPKTNSGDMAFTCVAAVLSLQLVALLTKILILGFFLAWAEKHGHFF